MRKPLGLSSENPEPLDQILAPLRAKEMLHVCKDTLGMEFEIWGQISFHVFWWILTSTLEKNPNPKTTATKPKWFIFKEIFSLGWGRKTHTSSQAANQVTDTSPSLSWALHMELRHITENFQGIALFKGKKRNYIFLLPAGSVWPSQHICSVSDHPRVVTGFWQWEASRLSDGKSSEKLIQVNQKIVIVNNRIQVVIQIFHNFCRQSCCISVASAHFRIKSRWIAINNNNILS